MSTTDMNGGSGAHKFLLALCRADFFWHCFGLAIAAELAEGKMRNAENLKWVCVDLCC